MHAPPRSALLAAVLLLAAGFGAGAPAQPAPQAAPLPDVPWPEPGAESVIGPDGRVRITPTTSAPWSGLAKVFFTTNSGSGSWCSASVIGPFHVLTAAHCVKPSSGGAFYTNLRIVPAHDDGWTGASYWTKPLELGAYGAARATAARVPAAWASGGNWEQDWALLTLDRNVGAWTGWMDLLEAPASDARYQGIVHTAGYPSDKDGGRNLYYNNNTGCTSTEEKHWYNPDTFGGQSGSAVWIEDAAGRLIVTVHGYGGGNVACGNSGARLSAGKHAQLAAWRALDAAPTDLADLMERVAPESTLTNPVQPFSGFAPATVRPGDPFQAWMRVRNAGLAGAPAFGVEFRISADASVNALDPLLGTAAAPPLAGLAEQDVPWGGTFPQVPDGTYFVAWAIDPAQQVAEHEEQAWQANHHRAAKVLVDGTPPSGSLLAPPAAAGPYEVAWSASDGGAGLAQATVERAPPGSAAWALLCAVPLTGFGASGNCAAPAAQGVHCHRLRVRDAAGNEGSAPLEPCTLALP